MIYKKEKIPCWLQATAYAVASFVCALFAFITITAVNALMVGGHYHLLGTTWNVKKELYGLTPMIVSTLSLAFLSTIFCSILAHGLFFWLRPGTTKWIRVPLQVFITFMTTIPTVVYSFTALFLLVPIIRQVTGGSGLSLFSASIVLAFQGLPTQVLILHNACGDLEKMYLSPCRALGLTDDQTTLFVTLPLIRQSRIEATLVGFGRAMGDALIPTMIAGNALTFPSSPFDSVRSLAAHISLTLSSEVTGGEHLSLLVAAFLLLCGSGLISFFIHRLGGKQ